MSFLDHLEELRWHIIRALLALVAFSIVAFVGKDFFFGQIVLGPSKTDFLTYRLLCQIGERINSTAICIEELPFILQSRKLTGQFSMHVISSFVIGIIIAFPYLFWEMWRFISPGLHSTERKAARGTTFFISLLFLVGVLFGYYIISPLSVNFLSNYSLDASIANEIDITSYVTTLAMLVLACGFLFQLPMVVFFLSKAGLITPSMMRTYRRHAIVVILVVSALLTPPDPFSQILISLPLFGLYQISIYISHIVTRKKSRA
ncbi:MAG: twin-arginine translocase subunit TatC [Bacteroidota bacterium]